MNPQKRPLRAMSDDPLVEIIEALADQVEGLADQVKVDPKTKNGGGVYVPPWILGPMMVLFVAMVLALTKTVVDVEIIKSNRFTSENAAEMRRSIEDRIPPPDVLRRLTDHEARLLRIENGGN